MSSSAQRRSQRASATPRRSARNSQMPSSPAPEGPDAQLQSEASQASQRGLTATPRADRLQASSTQSPLFYRSSPATQSLSGAGDDAQESDGGATPRASGMTIGGETAVTSSFSESLTNPDVGRLISYPLCLQLQPRSRPPCPQHGHSQQQQCAFRPRSCRHSSPESTQRHSFRCPRSQLNWQAS